jgi:peptidoglycan/LPS O-acetylase OafA/YrhL
MTGGELTVSMFFTLSGFLITRLMVAEWDASGSISLKRFYERRARRLFPASFIVLLLVAVIWTVFPGSGRRLAVWEWFSGLAYFENVYLQSAGKDYGGLFGLGNPLQHLWSLSLEEQVYVFFPILCLVVLRTRDNTVLRKRDNTVLRTRDNPVLRTRSKTVLRTRDANVWRLWAVLAVLAGAAIALGAWYRSHPPLWAKVPGLDAQCTGSSCAYYATEVRVGEFLLGAALGVLWMVWSRAPRILEVLRSRPASVLSWPILVFAYVVWFTVGWQNEWGHLFFPWAVLVNGLLTLVLILFAMAGTGMCRFLSWKPIAWLGQVTYTTYLVHWPMFLLWESWSMDPNLPRLRVPGTAWVTVDHFWIFIGKAASTLLVVVLIYHLVENPVRQRRMWSGARLFVWLAVLAIAGAIVVVVGIDRRASADDVLSSLDAEALALQNQALADLPDLPADAPDRSSVDPELPARVLMVGDSQSWVLASGLDGWEVVTGVHIVPSPGVGCGIAENTPIVYLGIEQDERPGCTQWREALPKISQKFRPNVIVVVGGAADLSNRLLPDTSAWTHIGRDDYDEWLLDQFAAFVDAIHVDGARIIWFSSPDIDPRYVAGETGIPPFDEADPARTKRYNELIERYARSDDRVIYADFARAVKDHPGGQFESKMRPDGAHIDLSHAPELIEWIDESLRVASRESP